MSSLSGRVSSSPSILMLSDQRWWCLLIQTSKQSSFAVFPGQRLGPAAKPIQLLGDVMTKLFVGSLPFETSESELQSMFTAFGPVTSAKIINDRETGRSRGFGFIEMNDDTHAQAAIEKLHGSTVGSRQIVVNVAKPMEKSGGFNRGGDRGGNRGGGGYQGGGRW
jgi:cold-inducible RNA-binding protein